MEALHELGLDVQVIRVGNDNLFQSAIFSETISHLMGSRIEVLDTTGAVGAAKASGVANGIYGSIREATEGNRIVQAYEPTGTDPTEYRRAFETWKKELEKTIHQPKS
jgi:xylulokinase